MQHQATETQVARVVDRIHQLGLQAHAMPGPTRTAIGITGNTATIDPKHLAGMPGVRDLIRVTKPYKLASREMQVDDTTVSLPQTTIGPGGFTIIAGPCSVENEQTTLQTAEFLVQQGVHLMRAGAFKPRTSPYSFQGMEHEGLRLLEKARQETGVGIVSEVMDASQAADLEASVDMLQIGTRNMQNFTLLKRVAQCRKPVLLKRGMSAKLEDWLMAAEYIMAGGNKQVVMCERGIRTFCDHARNTLDLGVVPALQERSHLPIIVDPSHAMGRRKYVAPMALAALASGADGIIVEIHPDPDNAMSDGAQSLDFAQFEDLIANLKRLAPHLGRELR